MPNPDGYLRIDYWYCGENPNNTVVETGEGTSQFSDFTFTDKDDGQTASSAARQLRAWLLVLRRPEVGDLPGRSRASRASRASPGPVPCGHGLIFSIGISW